MCLPKSCCNLGALDPLLGQRLGLGFAIRSPGQTQQLGLETGKRRLAAAPAPAAVAVASVKS